MLLGRMEASSTRHPCAELAVLLWIERRSRLYGYDLRRAPLIARKAALAEITGPGGVVRYSEHFEEDGPRLLRRACRLGLEGVVSKIRDAPYRSGRGKEWIKSKCSNRQEFVVAG
jgi:bifunctional non-homologous end joining protein LigD